MGTTAEVRAQKPTGYNYDLCPGAAPSFCGLPAPAPSTTYDWQGGDLPFPTPYRYEGSYCARNGTDNVTNIAGTLPGARGSNANDHQHWLSVYCGREIQINEALQIPGSDAVKTVDVGFANVNAKQARDYERRRRASGTRWRSGWSDSSTRAGRRQRDQPVRQRHSRVASRVGDPPTPARQFPRGYFGLQTHGGTDRIYYREIRVKELDRGDGPEQRRAALGRWLRLCRQRADVRPRRLGERRQTTTRSPGSQQPDRARSRALHAPAQEDLGASTLRPTRSSARCRCRTAVR